MKKDKKQTLEEKIELSLVKAGRFDVFGILEKLNKKRKRKNEKLFENLEVEVGGVDEFDITEWKPRVPRKKERRIK